MKFIVLISCLLFFSPILLSQKTEFSINKERALYEYHTQNIEIILSTYRISQGEITDSLSTLIIDLMTHKKGFVSIEFKNDREVIVEHQTTITHPMILKMLNRQGKNFIRKFENLEETKK